MNNNLRDQQPNVGILTCEFCHCSIGPDQAVAFISDHVLGARFVQSCTKCWEKIIVPMIKTGDRKARKEHSVKTEEFHQLSRINDFYEPAPSKQSYNANSSAAEGDQFPSSDDNEQFAADTLVGDIRDFFIKLLYNKSMGLRYDCIAESAQRELVLSVERLVQKAVKKAVRIIAAQDKPVVMGKLLQVTAKSQIRALVVVDRNDTNRHLLVDSQGKDVCIVLVDPTQFFGERGPAKIEPDQLALKLDSATNEPIF